MLEIEEFWTQFGLAGAVIGSLFAITMFVVKWALNFASRLSGEHKKERDEWRLEQRNAREEHRSERSEWRQITKSVADRHEEKLDHIVQTISDSIIDLARRDIESRDK